MRTYDVHCPRCDRHAIAVMVPGRGVRPHYREPFRRMRAERITCVHCGLVRDLSPEQGDDYRFWYRTTVRGEPVWAPDRRTLDVLIAWLSGEVEDTALGLEDRTLIEGLRSRLKERRAEAAERLRALRD
jgi:hypothetical protein